MTLKKQILKKKKKKEFFYQNKKFLIEFYNLRDIYLVINYLITMLTTQK